MVRKQNNKKENLCQKCRGNKAKYIKRFDYRKLPNKYFHYPDPLLMRAIEMSYFQTDSVNIFPDYWIDLPQDLILTKYDYRVCKECYEVEKQKSIPEWNSWENFP